jgi:CrcB protein
MSLTLNTFLSIFLGGGLGAFSRYFVSSQFIIHSFRPWLGTFVVNLTGCLIGALYWRFRSQWSSSQSLDNFVLWGLIGAYTTFSTFIFEVVKLHLQGQTKEAAICLILNVFFGVIICFFIFQKEFVR